MFDAKFGKINHSKCDRPIYKFAVGDLTNP